MILTVLRRLQLSAIVFFHFRLFLNFLFRLCLNNNNTYCNRIKVNNKTNKSSQQIFSAHTHCLSLLLFNRCLYKKMADEGNALVVWGSTGRRLQFSMQDLKMPESLRSDPHYHFYEKQWDAVASFWFNRVLKESTLQHLEVDRIVELIQQDIAKRWTKRRQEQSLHKKRKRLLQGNGPAGAPSNALLLTNVVPLEIYAASSDEEKKGLVQAVVHRVEAVAKESVTSLDVLVDNAPLTPATTAEEPAAKKLKSEDAEGKEPVDREGEAPTAAKADNAVFDDRVAIICTLSSKEKAALTIAHLHGSRFDGRSVLCRFWAPS